MDINAGADVITIGAEAFRGVTLLESVTIGAATTSIGANAFYRSEHFSSIAVDSANTAYQVVDNGLLTKDGTTFIVYPSDNDDLTHYDMPSTVVSIADNAFFSANLRTISLSEGLVSIGDCAFSSSYISAFDIPSTVETIGNLAFSQTNNLASITIGAENTHYKVIDNVLFNYDGTQLIRYAAADARESYDIPDGVTDLAAYAFFSADFTSCTMPDTVVTIGEGCFYCARAVDLEFSPNIKDIPIYAFYGCRLNETLLPTSLETIGELAFYGNNSIELQIFPNSLVSIGESAFEACSKLRWMYIPDSVTYIADNAFNYIYDNNFVYVYCNWGSYGASYAREHALSRQYVDDFVFDNGTITGYIGDGGEVVLPKMTLCIAENAFKDNDNITYIHTDTPYIWLNHIESNAFEGCSALKRVRFIKNMSGKGLTIDDEAFLNCTQLKSVDIIRTDTIYGESVFSGTNLGLTLYSYLDSTTEEYCSLQNIRFENIEDYDITLNELNAYLGTSANVIIPAYITDIDAGAFSGNTTLVSVTFPENIGYIPENIV